MIGSILNPVKVLINAKKRYGYSGKEAIGVDRIEFREMFPKWYITTGLVKIVAIKEIPNTLYIVEYCLKISIPMIILKAAMKDSWKEAEVKLSGNNSKYMYPTKNKVFIELNFRYFIFAR